MSEKILKSICGDYNRPVKIGDIEIPCFVLEDGTRVLTQFGFYKAIGRSGRPAKGRGAGFEKIPEFLGVNYIKPFVSEELASSKAIRFRLPTGQTAWGYKAELLPKVCEVYLKARDENALTPAQKRFAVACDIVMRGLAHVGIIALVDEVTGYQELRGRRALAKILEKYIAKEFHSWTKTFPDEFYREMFRLKNWSFDPTTVKKPSVIGRYTNDVVYERLAPGVLAELQRKNPTTKKGHRARRHHQWLTGDVGHPKLKEHLSGVMALMRASANWRNFKDTLARAYPKQNEQIPLALEIIDEE